MNDIDIANEALTLLGEAPVASFTQPNSSAAARLARSYPLVRDELLRTHRWNFAMRRALLAADPEPPAFGFGARFRLPNDCLQFVGVFDIVEPQQNYTSSRSVWRVEDGFLLYEGTSAPIFYVAAQPDASRFDPLFGKALIHALALRLAYATTANASLGDRIAQGFDMALRQARFANAIESSAEVAQTTEYTDARRSHGLSQRGFPGGIA